MGFSSISLNHKTSRTLSSFWELFKLQGREAVEPSVVVMCETVSENRGNNYISQSVK